MIKTGSNALAAVAIALAACRGDSTALTPPLPSLAADEAPPFSNWSPPVNLGATVNSPSVDQGASISKDGLSLYFHSTRLGGFGGADIYVSQRACADAGDPACTWHAPVNLGAAINTSADETAPRVTIDGHRLFFTSNRPTGFGGNDLYVARRRDKRDDLGWENAVNLGPGVNTALDEQTPDPFENDATGVSVLYYGFGPIGGGGLDIYMSTLSEDGTYGPGVPVPELNSPFLDRQPAISRDGLTIFFASDRTGTVGGLDLWMATRPTTSDPWSSPVNLGPTVNSTLVDARPALSFDGKSLYFQSTRPGNVGCTSATGPCVFDLWVTTRTKVKGPA